MSESRSGRLNRTFHEADTRYFSLNSCLHSVDGPITSAWLAPSKGDPPGAAPKRAQRMLFRVDRESRISVHSPTLAWSFVNVICRGGIVVGGWGDMAPDTPAAPADQPHPIEGLFAVRPRIRWGALFISATMLALILSLLPGRTTIAPLVESDYCYLLTASERFAAGHGLTATQPVAPFVSWQWRYDWGFLTQWPAGYPLLIAFVRRLFGGSTLDACRWVGVASCALALTGWFAWLRRSVPRGLTGVLLAAVGAACAVTVGSLTNPSTDAILIAAIPYVLLCASQHRESTELASKTISKTGASRELQFARTSGRRSWEMLLARFDSFLTTEVWAIAAGLIAGAMFWFRYASAFVPLAIGLFYALEWLRRSPGGFRGLVAFLGAAAVPIAALLIVNRVLGISSSAAEQLNLGSRVGFDFSWAKLWQAWWMFTDLGWYDHRPTVHQLLAAWPIAIVTGAIISNSFRQGLRSLWVSSAVRLGASLVVTLLGMLVTATAVFGAKFDYVGLDRYYLPIKPLYVLLLLSPLMLIPRRAVRAAMCVVLLLAGSWIVQQDWIRTYRRWMSADRSVTPSGAWSRCLEPGASQLYEWLRKQDKPELILASNFHEYVALETGIPAIPIPPDSAALTNWVSRISIARNVTNPRVLFVLDIDNKWRSHWIAPPDEIIAAFDLQPVHEAPVNIQLYLFERKVSSSAQEVDSAARDFVETDRSVGCVNGRDGFSRSAVERSRIDDAQMPDLLVAGDVGVAVENVIDLEPSQRIEFPFMPVKNGESRSVEFESKRNARGRRQTDRMQVRHKSVVGEIGIAPDE